MTDWKGHPLGLHSDGRVIAAASKPLLDAAIDALKKTLKLRKTSKSHLNEGPGHLIPPHADGMADPYHECGPAPKTHRMAK